MENILNDVMADMKARHRRVDSTPEALYASWPRPLRVGIVRVGRITISNSGILYGHTIRQDGVREIPTKDTIKIAQANADVIAANKRLDAVLKKAYQRARALTMDELVALGAEDHRS